MKYFAPILFFISCTIKLTAQEIKRNNNWAVGFNPGVIFDFNYNNITIDTIVGSRDSVYYQFYGAYGISNISDTNGKIALISNGFRLYNNIGNKILNSIDLNSPNGTLLQQHHSWDNWNQMSTIIPKSGNKYYVFTSGMSDKAFTSWKWGTTQDALYFDHLCYHVVDMDANNRQGEVISKNNLLMQDAFLCYDKMACVQHGNGKDWWLVKQHKNRHKFYVFLVTADTITLADSTDYNNGVIDMTQVRGQSCFSEDGKQYAFVSENWKQEDSNVYYYNFDRCTGKFSNYRQFKLPFVKNIGGNQQNGVAFSPNGNYLYVSSRKNIWQIDVTNNDNYNHVNIAGPDTLISYFQNYLNLKLAPDGKIYVGNWNNVRTMSYIEHPDSFGAACKFVPRGLRQNLTYLFIPPNNPKFGMGALAGSPCDTIRPPVIIPIPPAWVLYPNPAYNTINLQIPNGVVGSSIAISIYNVMGQVLQTKTYSINNKYEVSIPLQNLAAGMYIIKTSYNNSKFVGRFLKE
jgi:hypothetical protein